MHRYDLITEADARRLDTGATVVLRKGGHVTPLARDTLRARRITVVDDMVDEETASLAPAADVRRVALGSDHSGVAMKSALREWLRSRGLAVEDIGTHGTEPVDYPDIAAQVARLVARGEADAGIVIDGAGLGSAMAANKIDGVRAAMCVTPTLARYAREHNGANVLCLGAALIPVPDATDIVESFLQTTVSEPRYLRRLIKLRNLERTR